MEILFLKMEETIYAIIRTTIAEKEIQTLWEMQLNRNQRIEIVIISNVSVGNELKKSQEKGF